MSTAIATPEELDLSTDDPTYEVIDGVRVELPPMGIQEVLLAANLSRSLSPYVHDHGLGRVVIEGLFALGPGIPQRRPDLAYVSYARWRRGRKIDPTNAWAVVPDLAVEVVSPGNLANEVVEKIADYFKAGVRRVWVVYPTVQLVHVHESASSIRVVGASGSLEGDDVIPGFSITLAELFEDLIGDGEPLDDEPTS